jgi:hypothetical protein
MYRDTTLLTQVTHFEKTMYEDTPLLTWVILVEVCPRFFGLAGIACYAAN